MTDHVVISGTGRAGTTFLVQLLTQLGVDTGYAHPDQEIHANCDAGMEWDFQHADVLPYVLKSPFLCWDLDWLIDERGVVVKHAIVPMRDLKAAAASREDVARRTPLPPEAQSDGRRDADVPRGGWVPGGPIRQRPDESQEAALARMFYELILVLSRRGIPTSFLEFPRLVEDRAYLFDRLAPLFPRMRRKRFNRAFEIVARPELVHHFLS